MFYMGDHYPEIRERVYPEHRVQVKATRFRVPDICISAVGAPDEEIFTTPPALCIEILSREDTMSRIMERVKDYFAMGVPVCWIVDPIGRQGWAATPGHLDEATDGVLRADGIEMPLADVLE